MTAGECIKDWLGLDKTKSLADWLGLNEESQNEYENEQEDTAMTFREFIKKNGWQAECDTSKAKRMSIDIDFLNPNKEEDETQFDIAAFDVKELATLFADFCKENKFALNTVTNVVIVAVDDEMDVDF